MKNDKYHNNYSAEYLQKYLNGELSDKEMQALEKNALDDPFLADTIEGLEEARNHPVSFESGVADLQKRLSERVLEMNRKKRIPFKFTRWRVAASILIIAGLTTLTITLLKYNATPKTIAFVIKKDTQLISVHTAPSLVQTDTIVNNIKTNAEPQIPATIAQVQDQDKNIRPRQKPAMAIVSHEKEEGHETPEYSKGSVTDDSGKVATSADEVAATGYGATRKKDAAGSVTVVKNKIAQPEGWQVLNDYINKNKKINSADSVLTGEEVISFVLNKKGKLTSFKVIKSISSSHDAEVIRLLKSGPALKPTDGKKQKYQISIFFRS